MYKSNPITAIKAIRSICSHSWISPPTGLQSCRYTHIYIYSTYISVLFDNGLEISAPSEFNGGKFDYFFFVCAARSNSEKKILAFWVSFRKCHVPLLWAQRAKKKTKKNTNSIFPQWPRERKANANPDGVQHNPVEPQSGVVYSFRSPFQSHTVCSSTFVSNRCGCTIDTPVPALHGHTISVHNLPLIFHELQKTVFKILTCKLQKLGLRVLILQTMVGTSFKPLHN